MNPNNSNAQLIGLYFDDYSSGITATGNIVTGAENHDVEFHGGKDDSVSGNIFDTSSYNGKQAAVSTVLFQGAPSNVTPDNGPQAAANDSLKGNILLSNQASPSAFVDISYPTAASISGNLYWDPTTQFNTSPDTSPHVGDPGFVNPAGNNYALTGSGAASSINFADPNQAAMGLHPSGAHWYATGSS